MGSVRKKGDKWYFSIELPPVNGKRKRIERAGGRTKKEAMQKMALMEAEILKNGYQQESKMTFEELYNEWFEKYVKLNCKESTQKTYSSLARSQILPRIGGYKVTDIKPRVIRDYFNELKLKDYSSSVANYHRSLIKSCLGYAVFPLEIIESNPCDNVKMPKFDRKKEKKDIISQDMLFEIYEHGKKYYMFNELCILLYNTGLRIGEALALQWEDIDFDEKVMHIRHTLFSKNADECELTPPKTKSSIRDVYFNDEVEILFKRIKISQNENKLKNGAFYTHSNLVFTREDGRFFTVVYMSHVAFNISKKTGINFSMHTFRHTHATMLLQAGVGMKEIQARLGHSDIGITMNTYVESTEDSKKNTVRLYDEYLSKVSDI